MTIWHLDIAHVRIVGTGAINVPTGELRVLVEQAVQRALQTAPLAGGRAVRTSVDVTVPSLAGSEAIASAVGLGVTRAMGGRGHG